MAELADARAEPDGFWRLAFRIAEDHARLLIDKGSAALDGISLTVISPGRDRFEAAIIPHTWSSTNLRERRPGDLLNLELDMLAKHASRLLLPFQDEKTRVEE
jgi:riboflavin synthase